MSTEPTQTEAVVSRHEYNPTNHMNNFFLRFPASEKFVGDFGDYRRLIKKLGTEDQIIGQDYPEEQEKKKHSKLWLGQTYREFYAAIDQATTDSGLSLEEIRKMRDASAQEKDYDKREKMQQELEEKLKPIFERLLKEGYEPYDLSI